MLEEEQEAEEQESEDGDEGEEEEAKKSPEEEAQARISQLESDIKMLRSEVKIFEGQIANRNPALAKTVEKDNVALKNRIKKLRKILYALILDATKARHFAEEKMNYEALRKATVDFCKAASIDLEIWKEIES